MGSYMYMIGMNRGLIHGTKKQAIARFAIFVDEYGRPGDHAELWNLKKEQMVMGVTIQKKG
jgi:hypothetical protein